MKKNIYRGSIILLLLTAAISFIIDQIFGSIHSIQGFYRYDLWKSWEKSILFIAICITVILLLILLFWMKDKIKNHNKKQYAKFEVILTRAIFHNQTIDLNGTSSRITCAVILLTLLFAVTVIYSRYVPFTFRWYKRYPLVAHGGGAIETGLTGANNAKEGIERNYTLGHRVFEIDFSLTSDSILVAEHDWPYYGYKIGAGHFKSTEIPTYAEFMDPRFFGKYTPMDAFDILDVMLLYDDIYIMTDIKYSYDKVGAQQCIRQIVDAAYSIGQSSIM